MKKAMRSNGAKQGLSPLLRCTLRSFLFAAAFASPMLFAVPAACAETEPILSMATEEDMARYKDLLEKNSAEQIMERNLDTYRSVCLTREEYTSTGETVYSSKKYRDQEIYLELTDDNRAVCLTKDMELLVFPDSPENPIVYLYDETGHYAEALAATRKMFGLYLDEDWTLTATGEADGRLIFTTRNSDQMAVWNQLADLMQFDLSYEEGTFIECRTCFDAETENWLTNETTICLPSGEHYCVTRESAAYDTPFPDVEDTVLEKPLKAYLNRNDDGTGMRTITVVFEPGSDHEKTVEYRVPMGVSFDIDCQGSLPEDFYTDPECTQVYDYTHMDTDDGITLYIKM